MSKELVTQEAASKFKDKLKRQLIDHADEFWENMRQLKPKDFCDVYLKMMPYGFSRVPDERPIDDETKQKLILEETTRKATLIGGGLPDMPEDVPYEED